MENLGFTFVVGVPAQDTRRSVPYASACTNRDWSLSWQSLGRTAAVAVFSAALMVPGTATALESPLVFDHDQSLVGADFSNRSDLKGAIFSKSNCKSASFVESDLTNAQLDDANFQEANLQGAVAANASATKAKFQRANLKDVDFTNANLISAQFDGANIEGADFTDSLLDRAVNLSLCKRASGVNSKTGVSTAESLMCPE